MRVLKIGVLVFCLSLVLTNQIIGQNLVPNGDFEEYSTCPTSMSQLNYVNEWMNPNASLNGIPTPDYYNSCDTSACSMGLDNMMGSNLYAYSGNGYAGIVTYHSTIANVREYIAIELDSELIEGEEYAIQFYIKNPNVTRFATRIGAHLSPDLVLQEGYVAYNIESNAVDFTTSLDTGWIELSNTFISNGGEKFLTIGSFYDDVDSGVEMFWGEEFSCAAPILLDELLQLGYYLIDDVSVIKKETIGIEGIEIHEKAKLEISPNPSTGLVYLNWGNPKHYKEYNIKVFNALGKLVENKQVSESYASLELSKYGSKGCFFVEIISEGKSLAIEKLVLH